MLPVTLSAAFTIYEVVRLFGAEKKPAPVVVHVPPVATVTIPVSPSAAASEQMVAGPAFTVGASVIVTAIASDTALQIPCAVLVRVNVTVPAAVSAADGV